MRTLKAPEVGHRPQFVRWLTRWLRHHTSASVRYGCACQAEFRDHPDLLSALTQRAADLNEQPLVRGVCLEMLVWTGLRADRRAGRLADRAFRVIKQSLRDPDPNVRFWACYAAAELDLQSAQAGLRALLDDSELGLMGWTVAYEAGEALKKIRGEPAWEDDPIRLPNLFDSTFREWFPNFPSGPS